MSYAKFSSLLKPQPSGSGNGRLRRDHAAGIGDQVLLQLSYCRRTLRITEDTDVIRYPFPQCSNGRCDNCQCNQPGISCQFSVPGTWNTSTQGVSAVLQKTMQNVRFWNLPRQRPCHTRTTGRIGGHQISGSFSVRKEDFPLLRR